MPGCDSCDGCSGGCGGGGDDGNDVMPTLISYGDAQIQGVVVGVSIAELRMVLAQVVPDVTIPADTTPRIFTVNPQDPLFLDIPGQMYRVDIRFAEDLPAITTIAKDVGEDYVIRNGDILLEFRPKDAPAMG